MAEIQHLPHGFSYKNSKLYVENICYTELVERFGTPILAFSEATLISNLTVFRNAATKYLDRTSIHFALKSCYFAPVLQALCKNGVNAEIMSEMEYHLAILAGWKPSQIIWNGPGKTIQDFEIGVKNKIKCINIDSFSEFEKLETICKRLNRQQTVGIRIHPDDQGLDTAFIKRGERLGLDVLSEDTIRLFQMVSKSPWVNLKGIHAHIFVRNSSVNIYRKYIHSLCLSLRQFNNMFDANPIVLNVGGGFETRSLLQQNGLYFKDFIKAAATEIKKTELPIEVVFEPGRCIANDACVALTKVITKKDNAGKTWLMVNIGSNILIPLANAGYQVVNAMITDNSYKTMSVGDQMCYSAGIIQKDVPLLPVSEGDVLAVLQCGAYTYSMAEFFGYTLPSLIWVSGTHANLIQKSLSPEKGAKMIFNGYNFSNELQ